MADFKKASIVIDTLPSAERPRERCLHSGPQSLSLRECVALILGSGPPGIGCLGVASRVIHTSNREMSSADEARLFFIAMESTSHSHLERIAGLGDAGKAKLMAAFEIARRYANFRDQSRTQHRDLRCGTTDLSDFAYHALARITAEHRSHPREWLGFVPFYRSGEVGHLCIVEKGVRTHVNIEPAEFFARLLALRPEGFFIAHNHPSGDLTASAEDRDLTTKIAAVARRLGLHFLGHWIVSAQGEEWLEG